MWCRHCQQETPALGPPSASGPRCGRCSRTSPVERDAAPRDEPSIEPIDADDARRAVYRSLRSAHATISAGEPARTVRYDIEPTRLAEAFRGPHQAAPARPRPSTPPPLPPTNPTGAARSQQLGAWLLASIGATSLGLGIGLGAWSLLGARPELWNPALAAAIGGQGLLIVGLLQLLASLWTAARLASGKLSMMHDELRRLRRHADASAGRHHATAAGFYADLARDASPDQMVGNLRGQLDQLASRLR